MVKDTMVGRQTGRHATAAPTARTTRVGGAA
jgi:hypothetical protein